MRRERHFDFNHQSIEAGPLSILKPGDQLTMSCTYDTSSRMATTSFGDLTQQEMCWSAFIYYPAQRSSSSHTSRTNGRQESHATDCDDGTHFFNAEALTAEACVQRGDISQYLPGTPNLTTTTPGLA